jgi:phenylacetic acid degradation operon negative regulatory protein
VASAVRECDLQGSVATFVGTATDAGLDEATLVASAWDLTEIARRYRELADRFGGRDVVGPEQSLEALLDLAVDLKQAPSWDPRLPPEVTPGWGGRLDAARLLELRRRWLVPARRHWRAAYR